MDWLFHWGEKKSIQNKIKQNPKKANKEKKIFFPWSIADTEKLLISIAELARKEYIFRKWRSEDGSKKAAETSASCHPEYISQMGEADGTGNLLAEGEKV